ncbi:MAG: hypothetical protein UY72_C0064G0005 [Candidatus Uhrbacteria bacterium GW2011_GWD2_52_7]|uniref:Uncharacterized protein n=1 Tax=Candidatus Uhrbacteria bacterium GW2011_GWD2_52_7 TaxID=1618989 RepID=A0A0G1ZKX4_9BACT|nr:MAG: hypothetical protein UY72_C0064G0005 [Candidatus Uhrbacteria bacterium GW2011_GWD2_52_7]
MRTLFICPSFIRERESRVVGYKIPDLEAFIAAVKDAFVNPDLNEVTPGEFVISKPEISRLVKPGIGKRSNNPEDYVLRNHRGKVGAFLKREFAIPYADYNVIIWTLPRFSKESTESPSDFEDLTKFMKSGCTHALVGAKAASAVVDAEDFVRNIMDTPRQDFFTHPFEVLVDDVRNSAQRVTTFYDMWSLVAD